MLKAAARCSLVELDDRSFRAATSRSALACRVSSSGVARWCSSGDGRIGRGRWACDAAAFGHVWSLRRRCPYLAASPPDGVGLVDDLAQARSPAPTSSASACRSHRGDPRPDRAPPGWRRCLTARSSSTPVEGGVVDEVALLEQTCAPDHLRGAGLRHVRGQSRCPPIRRWSPSGGIVPRRRTPRRSPKGVDDRDGPGHDRERCSRRSTERSTQSVVVSPSVLAPRKSRVSDPWAYSPGSLTLIG